MLESNPAFMVNFLRSTEWNIETAFITAVPDGTMRLQTWCYCNLDEDNRAYVMRITSPCLHQAEVRIPARDVLARRDQEALFALVRDRCQAVLCAFLLEALKT